MKKSIIISVCLLLVLHMQAQITNPGFEMRNADGTAAYWQRLPASIVVHKDSSCTMTGSLDSIAFVTTDAHSGSYAFEMRALNYCDSFGMAGNIQTTLYNVDTSFVDKRIPFTERSKAFTFYYKLLPVKKDYALVNVLLENDNGTVASAELKINSAAASWSLATMPLIYINTDTPKYLTITFQLVNDSLVHYGSRFLIDDINHIVTTGIPTGESRTFLSCYPVPAGDELFLQINGVSTANGLICITDAMGKVIKTEAISFLANTARINVKDLARGMYFIQLSIGAVSAKGRFVK